MPRVDVTMSAEEIGEFLSSQTGCVMAARDPAGHLHPAIGRIRASGQELMVWIPKATPAATALLKDGRVCCVVEHSPTYHEIAYVAVRGIATGISAEKEELCFRLPLTDVSSASFAKLPTTLPSSS